MTDMPAKARVLAFSDGFDRLPAMGTVHEFNGLGEMSMNRGHALC